MNIEYYPDKTTVDAAQQVDDPLLILVSYDKRRILISNIDDAFEHHILLKKLGYSELDIDKYYRVIVNQDGADWTFVCPSDYKGIKDKDLRIKEFYNDGIDAISKAIQFIGYESNINIPKRYRRHFNMLGE
ncbi:MAG: hypothetical protein N2645_18445 [Clostridia bacterium]|nr:hypothetical protein [Clostridia bacterium]